MKYLYLLSKYTFFLMFAFFLQNCEKEITVDVPDAEQQIVVEGSIETNQPPIILLTRSQGYFAPTDLNSIANNFVRNAEVSINDGNQTILLDELCTAELPTALLPIVQGITGLTEDQLVALNLCFYTSLNPAAFGVEGRTYALDIMAGEDHLTSITKINPAIPLDSVWFELSGENDSLGFAHGFLTDPDTLGNVYRWFAKRINTYPAGSPLAGQPKDLNFIAPLGSINDDQFFNGLSFEFMYARGSTFNSSKDDDNNGERGYFKVGDTIAVKEATLDYNAYRFFYDLENQLVNQGSPFASPTEIRSNIEGGLGVFVGYGVNYDTIICLP